METLNFLCDYFCEPFSPYFYEIQDWLIDTDWQIMEVEFYSVSCLFCRPDIIWRWEKVWPVPPPSRRCWQSGRVPPSPALTWLHSSSWSCWLRRWRTWLLAACWSCSVSTRGLTTPRPLPCSALNTEISSVSSNHPSPLATPFHPRFGNDMIMSRGNVTQPNIKQIWPAVNILTRNHYLS